MKRIFLLVVFLLIESFSFAQTKLSQKTYEGFINKFPISLTLTFDANLVYGTLLYKRVGQPIKVIGSLEGDEFSLNEFGEKTEITGLYFGTKKGDEIFKNEDNYEETRQMLFSLQKPKLSFSNENDHLNEQS